MTTFHLIQLASHAAASIDGLLAFASTAWLALGEIFSVGALLLALNFIASAVKRTYQAGRFVGRIWFCFIVPTLLTVADAISWLSSQIDWQQVGADLACYLKALVAFVITVTTEAQPALVRFSERMGKAYAALLVGDREAVTTAAKVAAGRAALIIGAAVLSVAHAVGADAIDAAKAHGPRLIAQVRAAATAAIGHVRAAVDHVQDIRQAFVLVVS